MKTSGLSAVISAGAFLFAATPAEARCQWSRSNFYLSGDETTNVAICDGRGGSYNFTSRGVIEFTSFSVVQHPRNGKLSPRDGLGLQFRPAPGFRGDDRFIVRMCGTNRNVPGCSTINFRLTVQ